MAGTQKDKGTGQYRIHILRLAATDGAVVFEQTYSSGLNSWAMSICSFDTGSSTGYAITGFVEDAFLIRRTLVFTINELGALQQSKTFEQVTSTTHGMGLNIQATPNATNQGFVLVGMVHDNIVSGLTNTQKQGFCMKIDQNLSLVWEQYLDTPLNISLGYNRDYDAATFVTPTDQGYFITGSKNCLSVLGLQRQGILAVMLDANGTQLWDASYFTGNIIDHGVSAFYDQSKQKVYALTNISVIHHFGLSVFDASTGALDANESFEALSSNGDLDKYGQTIVKAPFQDKLMILGRGSDAAWANTTVAKGQPAFLVDYDLNTEKFGIHYLEKNNSHALQGLSAAEDPFYFGSLKEYYYPQSLVNINNTSSAMLSYAGDNAGDVKLVVRQFRHLSTRNYDFCNGQDSILLDSFRVAHGFPGEVMAYSNPASVPSNTALSLTLENTLADSFCYSIITDTEVPFAEEKLQFFPNPVRDQLLVQWEEPGLFHGIELYNSKGQRLQSIPLTASQAHAELRLQAYPAGLYFLRLRTMDGQLVGRKLIKQ